MHQGETTYKQQWLLQQTGPAKQTPGLNSINSITAIGLLAMFGLTAMFVHMEFCLNYYLYSLPAAADRFVMFLVVNEINYRVHFKIKKGLENNLWDCKKSIMLL